MDYVIVDDQPRLGWHCHRPVLKRLTLVILAQAGHIEHRKN